MTISSQISLVALHVSHVNNLIKDIEIEFSTSSITFIMLLNDLLFYCDVIACSNNLCQYLLVDYPKQAKIDVKTESIFGTHLCLSPEKQ